MCECMRERKRERSTPMNKVWGMNYIIKIALASSKYKNTFHEVYIGFMCKGAHVLREYKYTHVSPTLND